MLSEIAIARIKALHKSWREEYISGVDKRWEESVFKLRRSGAGLSRYVFVPESEEYKNVRT